MGSGNASVSMRSKPAAASAEVRSWPVTSRIHGSRPAIAFGVRAPDTRRRMRVWSGGSMVSRSAAGSSARGIAGRVGGRPVAGLVHGGGAEPPVPQDALRRCVIRRHPGTERAADKTAPANAGVRRVGVGLRLRPHPPGEGIAAPLVVPDRRGLHAAHPFSARLTCVLPGPGGGPPLIIYRRYLDTFGNGREPCGSMARDQDDKADLESDDARASARRGPAALP